MFPKYFFVILSVVVLVAASMTLAQKSIQYLECPTSDCTANCRVKNTIPTAKCVKNPLAVPSISGRDTYISSTCLGSKPGQMCVDLTVYSGFGCSGGISTIVPQVCGVCQKIGAGLAEMFTCGDTEMTMSTGCNSNCSNCRAHINYEYGACTAFLQKAAKPRLCGGSGTLIRQNGFNKSDVSCSGSQFTSVLAATDSCTFANITFPGVTKGYQALRCV